jgi:hypothetical protein
MSKGNFKFRPLHPILKSTGRAGHVATSTLNEAIAPSHRAAREQQRSPHEIIEDCRPGCRRLADSGEGSKEMHAVYASPGAIDAYRKTGHFPDGAVLVKEVFATSTNEMTTGTVSHADKLKGWFVMVKDSKGTHPGNPLWGDGWGWSWFDADKPLKTTSTDYHSDCQGCHVPAKATDWIYVNGYPVLRH